MRNFRLKIKFLVNQNKKILRYAKYFNGFFFLEETYLRDRIKRNTLFLDICNINLRSYELPNKENQKNYSCPC